MLEFLATPPAKRPNTGSAVAKQGPYVLRVLCEINEDDCGPGPSLDSGLQCLHSATCVDLVGGFRCNCPPEYTGSAL
ncbi:hypothetical protein A6R68_13899 [Neotoma lepida]|uniref:EGF-like domain-containing protein n=1 Tax=Neotoma lepida TaxID=56216 RepID=A0A1A6GZV4_NEOLE|nr:hypothetical protein A6R68_13899 [Neotoma lepida]